ncbi:MAG TPA: ABC transporter permease [Thermomicrobiaceae bacterium]|nr:ABC transporter permease [Thermomicrobiaceae bacterium]
MSSVSAATTPDFGPKRRERGLFASAMVRYAHNRVAVAALLIVVVLVAMAVFAPILRPEGYDNQVYSQAWQFPSRAHPMGTDPYGRDMLTRVIYGARVSLSVALVVNLAAFLIGAPIGAAAGWFGGAVDFGLMRVVDVTSAFPTLLFAILMLAILGSGLVNIYIALSVTSWIAVARLVRAQVLSLREQDYVLAARALGASNRQIITNHLIPNSLTPVIVALTLGIPAAIMGEAGLSFLGIGVNSPTPSWGKMLNQYLPYVQSHWYLSFFPGVMIALAMYAFTLMGDGLQDALDPTAK